MTLHETAKDELQIWRHLFEWEWEGDLVPQDFLPTVVDVQKPYYWPNNFCSSVLTLLYCPAFYRKPANMRYALALAMFFRLGEDEVTEPVVPFGATEDLEFLDDMEQSMVTSRGPTRYQFFSGNLELVKRTYDRWAIGPDGDDLTLKNFQHQAGLDRGRAGDWKFKTKTISNDEALELKKAYMIRSRGILRERSTISNNDASVGTPQSTSQLSHT